MLKDDSFKYLIIGCVVILFGYFIWSIKPFLSPLIIAVSILIFLIPVRKNPLARSVMIIVSIIFLGWIIFEISDVLFPFLVAFSLAYLFDPLIDFFETKKIPRTGGILIVVLIIVGLIYFSAIIIVPEVTAELAILIKSLPTYEEIKVWMETDFFQFMMKLGFSEERLQQIYSEDIPKQLHQFVDATLKNVTQVATIFSTFANHLLNIILVPFVTFYFLRDFHKIRLRAKELIPTAYKVRVVKFVRLMDDLTHQYFRGKFTVVLILSIVATFALYLFELKFSLIIGLATGILTFIPYVGLIINFIIGILLGLLNDNPAQAVAIIVIVIAALQLLDMLFLSPRVIGHKLGIEPVTLILSILVFAKLFGVIGLIVSVPFAAILKVTALHFYEDWSKKHHLYETTPANEDTDT